MKIFQQHRLVFLLLPLVFSFFFVAGTVDAATGLTIRPVKVSHTLKPGESVSGVIYLKSNSDGEAVSVVASVEDFVPVAGAEGLQFVGRAPGVTTVRDWVHLGGQTIFSLKQGEELAIPYTITAPWNAEPGSHFGVAFFKATQPNVNGGTSLSVGVRIGMLILVTVPGNHLQKGRILDFTGPSFVQKPPVSFKIKFENTGTVHFEPKGTLILRNMFGQEVGKVPIEGQTVLPTGIKDMSVEWNVRGWLLGRYSATAVIFDGEGTALTTGNVGFWVIPVWYILGFLAAIVVLFFFLRWFKHRVRVSIALK